MRRSANRAVTVLLRTVLATWPLAVFLLISACQQGSVPDRSGRTQAGKGDSSGLISRPQLLGAPFRMPDGSARPALPGAVAADPSSIMPPTEGDIVPPVAGEIRLRLPPGAHDMTRIALLLPLSGADAALGKSMLRAAQIAVFDLAADDFLLLPYDTGGEPNSALAAARAALDAGAQLVLGPLFAESVRAVAPVVREAGLNMVVFSNNRAVAGDSVYVLGLLPGEQIARVVSYARAQGIVRFAGLVPDSPYGHNVADDLYTAVTRFGGVVSHVEFYAADGSDLSQAVRRLGRYDDRRGDLLRQRRELKNSGDPASMRRLARLKDLDTLGEVDFDALLVPVGGSRLKEIAALLPFYDIETKEIRLLGVASWLTPGLGREPPLVGGWFAAPQTRAGAQFEQRFRKLFGRPPHVLSALAYDATALAAIIARGDAGFSADALTSPNGFAGTAGIFRLHPEGEVERGLAVFEVEPWRFRVISPSPETFESLEN